MRKTLIELDDQITDFFADNESGQITEEKLREFFTNVKDSFTHLDAKDVLDTALTSLSNEVDTKADIESRFKDDLSTPLTFAEACMYGRPPAPCTGTINANLSGAKLMVKCCIIHAQGSPPTFPGSFVKVSGSYSTTRTNFIECTYVGAGTVYYSITQEP